MLFTWFSIMFLRFPIIFHWNWMIPPFFFVVSTRLESSARGWYLGYHAFLCTLVLYSLPSMDTYRYMDADGCCCSHFCLSYIRFRYISILIWHRFGCRCFRCLFRDLTAVEVMINDTTGLALWSHRYPPILTFFCSFPRSCHMLSRHCRTF